MTMLGTRVSHGRSNICPSVIVPLSLPVVLILNDECVYRGLLARIQVYTICVARETISRLDFLLWALWYMTEGSSFHLYGRYKRFTRQARESSHRENDTRRSVATLVGAAHRTKRFRVYRRVYPLLAVVCSLARCAFHVAFL